MIGIAQSAFNRTSMESKQMLSDSALDAPATFNRTSMESKLSLQR